MCDSSSSSSSSCCSSGGCGSRSSSSSGGCCSSKKVCCRSSKAAPNDEAPPPLVTVFEEPSGPSLSGPEQTKEFIETYQGCPSQTEAAGKSAQCAGCPGRLLCSSQSQEPPDQKNLNTRMSAIKHKILILSGKGGVGKSTVAIQLATSLAQSGKTVGLLDVDLCGPSIPLLLNLEGSQVVSSAYGWIPPKAPNFPNLKVMSSSFLLADRNTPVIYRGPRKQTLIRQFLKDTFWGKLDYLIVDTPPGTSDEHIAVLNALKAVNPDGAVIVTTPQDLAKITVQKEIKFCQKMNLPILGIVENMKGFVCPCCQEVTEIFGDKGAASRLSSEYGVELLGSIPIDPTISSRADQGLSAIEQVSTDEENVVRDRVKTIVDNIVSRLSSKP